MLIVAPSEELPKTKVTLFLAGGISNCADWQGEVTNYLFKQSWWEEPHSFTGEKVRRYNAEDAYGGYTVYNPRRHRFDVKDKSATEVQIRWEWQRLQTATDIFFWFAPETLNPIVLFELGCTLERNYGSKLPNGHKRQNLYIGVHPKYERKEDVRLQTSLYMMQENVKPHIYSKVIDMADDFLLAFRNAGKLRELKGKG